MPLKEAIWLALNTIRVQKLKSFFTLVGVMIGVMFLIAVVSIVEGMSDYVENDFAGKLIGVNTYTLRRFNEFTPDDDNQDWRAMQRRPRIYMPEVEAVRGVLPPGTQSAVTNETFLYASGDLARPRQVQAVATEASYFAIKKFNVTNGRAFVPQEVSAGARVVVIGTEVAIISSRSSIPSGAACASRRAIRVIGVIEEQGFRIRFSLDRWHRPYTSPCWVIRPAATSMRCSAGVDVGAVDGGSKARGKCCGGMRRLGPAERDDFAIDRRSRARVLRRDQGQDGDLRTALPPSLVVGAMVIMNIMLLRWPNAPVNRHRRRWARASAYHVAVPGRRPHSARRARSASRWAWPAELIAAMTPCPVGRAVVDHGGLVVAPVVGIAALYPAAARATRSHHRPGQE